jgi:hypothetical protein
MPWPLAVGEMGLGRPMGFAVLPHVETSGAMTVMVRNQSGDFHVSGQESGDFGDMSKKTITQALISSATTIVLKINSPIYQRT